MASDTISFNLGWTIHGRSYHRAVYHLGIQRFVAPSVCGIGMLEQTVFRSDGEPTGVLVPEDLRPCKRCFTNGDAPLRAPA